MKKYLILSIWCLLFTQTRVAAKDSIVLKGRVERLDKTPVEFIEVQLPEPGVTGSTDKYGVFEMTLPPQWLPGKQTTILVDLENHAVLRPWDGKLTIQRQPEGKLEKIIVAERRLVNLVQNDLPRVERIIQGERLAEFQRRSQPESFGEFEAFRAHADSLNISPTDLLALLNEWKTHAETSANLSEQALAALYEKKYCKAIDLFDRDIANDESKIAAADTLRQCLPHKYLNKGIAHAGLYEHEKAQQAFKKAYTLDSTLVVAELWLIATLKFTGRLDEAMALLQKNRQRYLSKADSSVSYTWTLNNIGEVYRTRGKLDSALVYYRRSLAIEKKLNRPEGMAYDHFNMGLLFEQMHDYEKAAAHIHTAFVYFSRIGSPYARNAALYYQRVMAKSDPFYAGRIYLSIGDTAKALAAYRDSLAAHPDSLQGYIHIASVYSQTGPPDSVVANYRAVLEKDPNHATALNGLALCPAQLKSRRSAGAFPTQPGAGAKRAALPGHQSGNSPASGPPCRSKTGQR